MKENKYDDPTFFNEYSKMSRSVDGLDAAGEWHELKKMLPSLQGKRVLDLGCGFGWHCIYAAEQGASYVLGVDISENMLKIAKEKTHFPQVEYQRSAIEDIDCTANSFDLVLSSLAFHYIADFSQIVNKVKSCLKSNGHFVFSVEHPIFTAYGTQAWYYDLNGKILHYPVDNYFIEGKRQANFLGEEVTKYHKTLTTYLNTLIQANFEITNIVEPMPSPELLKSNPKMQDELRRPMMLLISACKKD